MITLGEEKMYGVNSVQEQRRMSMFMQYAMLASNEALQDAAWRPKSDQQREMTVSYHPSNAD